MPTSPESGGQGQAGGRDGIGPVPDRPAGTGSIARMAGREAAAAGKGVAGSIESLPGTGQTGRERRHLSWPLFPADIAADHGPNHAMQPVDEEFCRRRRRGPTNQSRRASLLTQRIGSRVEKAQNGAVRLSRWRKWSGGFKRIISSRRRNRKMGPLRHTDRLITNLPNCAQLRTRAAAVPKDSSGLPPFGSRGPRQTSGRSRRENTLE